MRPAGPGDAPEIELPIVTERLLIRPFTRADAEAMYHVFSDPCVMWHMPGGARDRNGTLVRLDSLIEHHKRHGFSKWTVVDRTDGAVIGDCGIQLLDGGPDIELGFHLRRDRWGRGFATEAAGACLAWAASHRPESLVAIVDPLNARSVRVLEKIGMRRIGSGSYFNQLWDVYQSPQPSRSYAAGVDSPAA